MANIVSTLTFAQVPIFSACLLLEWFTVKHLLPGKRLDLRNTVSDISCGLSYLFIELLFHSIAFASYLYLFQHFSNASVWNNGPVLWLSTYIFIDFAFYWWHRLHHRVNVLWGIHSVHHQGHQFTFSLALRQPAFEPLTWFVFYLPLAMLGVPFEVYGICHILNRSYQFFMHTELVPKLGFYEWIFCTPSQHRVHHGVLPHYLDKNYGGTFCIWDRLFGTFEKEVEPTPYGVTSGELPLNPLDANLNFFRTLGKTIQSCDTLANKLRFIVNPPGELPCVAPIALPSTGVDSRFHADESRNT